MDFISIDRYQEFYDKKFAHYNVLKKEMQTGDLLQWETNCLLMWFYRKLIKATVNHSSMVLRLPEFESSEERRFTTEAHGKTGTALNLLSHRLKTHHGKVWYYKLKEITQEERKKLEKEVLKDLGITHKERKKIGQAALEQIGKPYDFYSVGISTINTALRTYVPFLRKVLPKRCKADAKNLFCSEYIFYAYLSVLPEKIQYELAAGGAPHPKDITKLGIYEKRELLFDSKTWDIPIFSILSSLAGTAIFLTYFIYFFRYYDFSWEDFFNLLFFRI